MGVDRHWILSGWARSPDVPMQHWPGKTNSQRVTERTRKILDMVRAQHNRSLEMDDETAEAAARELGIPDDDRAEGIAETVGYV